MDQANTTATTTSTANSSTGLDSNEKSFTVKVATITGTSCNILTQKTESVQQLKDRIFNAIHIVPELQRLTFQDKVLEYGLLEDYGLQEGSTIFLSPVLKAGTASSTKRSLNIDQKSVSELIKSLPQEQLAILLNQKKPVTVTAKMGDHVVVFTLVPSDSPDTCQEPTSPSSPFVANSSLESSPSPLAINSRSTLRRREQSYSLQPSLEELVPAPSEEVNLSERVQLIRKRLSLKRVLDDIERQRQEELKSNKKHRRHRLNRVSRKFRQSHRHSHRCQHLNERQEHLKLIQEQRETLQRLDNLESQSVQEQKHTLEDLEEGVENPHNKEIDIEMSESISCEGLSISPATPSQLPIDPSAAKEEPLISLKCSRCCKKLKPMRSYTCKCGHVFCIDHRHQNFNLSSEKGHNCSFDFKALGKEELRAQNPLIQGPKVQHI